MLTESKKPMTDLLSNPSFKQDVVYEYEETVDGEKQKRQLVIPYAEFGDPSKPNAKLNSGDFLKAFFTEKNFKMELPAKAKKNL